MLSKKEYNRKYYQEHLEETKKRCRENARLYYRKNREEILQKKVVYLEENNDKINKRKRKQRKNPEVKKQYNFYNKNRQHLKRANGIGITNQQWNEILKKYNFRCAYCGMQGNMTIDHITPLSKGGEHSSQNVAPACAECNGKKGTKLSWIPKIFRKEG